MLHGVVMATEVSINTLQVENCNTSNTIRSNIGSSSFPNTALSPLETVVDKIEW
jgi:hypothetical protein